jgi:hypothetical protein
MRSVLAVFCLAIMLMGPVNAAAPVQDTLIVPGERVGPVALGMNPAELAQAVGSPGDVQHQGSATIYSWGQIVAEIADKSPGVDLITVNDPRYETANHIRVGLAGLAVTAVLGLPASTTTQQGLITLDYDGLTVIMRNNLVAQIRVQKSTQP